MGSFVSAVNEQKQENGGEAYLVFSDFIIKQGTSATNQKGWHVPP